MAITYTPNLNLGMQLDKTDYVDWDVITQNWQKIDDTAFTGELTVENPFFDINLAKSELRFNQQSAHSGGYQISPTTIFHYNGAWEWCITYRPKYSTSNPVCLIGTVGSFYSNPTVEIQNDGAKVWLAVSKNASSWTNDITATTANGRLLERIQPGNEYSFILGINTDGGLYAKIIKINTGEVIMQRSNAASAIQNNTADQSACLLCNGGNYRFYLTGDIVLPKTYYKENGAVLWGNKAYAAKMEEGDER